MNRTGEVQYPDVLRPQLTTTALAVFTLATALTFASALHAAQPPAPGHAADLQTARAQQALADKAMNDLLDMLGREKEFDDIAGQWLHISTKLSQLKTDTSQAAADLAGKPAATLTDAERARLSALAGRQEAIRNQVDALLDKMTREIKTNSGDNPEDQSRAAALDHALHIAHDLGLVPDLKTSADLIRNDQPASAGPPQDHAVNTLGQIAGALAERPTLLAQFLGRRMQTLAQAIAKLIEQQKHELAGLDAGGEMPALIDPLSQLHRNTLDVFTKTRTDLDHIDYVMKWARHHGPDQEAPVSGVEEPLRQACDSQTGAIAALRNSDRTLAREDEAAALKHLEAAFVAAQNWERAIAHELVQDNYEKTQAAYEVLAKRQLELRGQVEPLADKPDRPRQEVAALMEMAAKQAGIRLDADQLKASLDSPVYTQMHAWIDDQSAYVEHRLRAAQADQPLLADQKQIAEMFVGMAQAIGEAKKKEDTEFLRPRPATQEPDFTDVGPATWPPLPAIPPAAALKLIRTLQQAVYDQTARINKFLAGAPAEGQVRRDLWNLSGRQAWLADLSEKIRKTAPAPADIDQTNP